jgi:hypothetical protein
VLSIALSVLLVALLGALPTASASASSSTPGITLPATVSGLPSGEVEKLLTDIPLGELSKTQLTEALSKLPGLGTLPANKLDEALTKTIESLTGKDATLGALLNPNEIVPTLETQLKKLLSLPELLSLLGPNTKTKLTEALGSLNPSQLLDTLLGSSDKPEQLLTQLFGALNPETLKTLLGTTLTGEPFTKMTVGELANQLEMTTTTLDKELGTTTEQLPEGATALTTPLTDGKTLGVLDGLDGVTLGLLGSGSQEKTPGGESGSGGGSGGSGGNGGSGGTDSGAGSPNGSSAAPGTTTVLVNVPLAQSAPTQSPGATKKTGKIKILSHRVRGKNLTLVVQVPAAGKIALGGNGIKSLQRETAKAENVTLRTVLTKAAVASLRSHRHGLRVKLKASFKIAGGSSSSALLTVTFA